MTTSVIGEVAEADAIPRPAFSPGRASPLNGEVDKILANPAKRGKATCIAHYEGKTAAGGAASVLRQRYGKSITAKGLEFAVRKVTVRGEDGHVQERHGLWVYYDPTRIEKGHWETHVKNEQVRQDKVNQKNRERAERKKAEANGQ